ncbi:ATP synthase subunit d [Blattella germanica]|nr:ATP synthase subunit d [Blattella germanica]
MAARRITQASINWTALAERVPENQKPFFAAFKSKSDAYLRRMMANPETPPKIDWAYYKARVPVAGMVDDFQKKYDTLQIPYPADTVSAQIDQQQQQVSKEVQDFVKKSNDRIAEYQSEVSRLKALIPYELMTMEDFRDAYPELALDPMNKPTFWPHTAEEQLEYNDPRAAQEEHH